MVYRVIFEIDGGCRNNGHDEAVGAAAAVCIRGGIPEVDFWYKEMPSCENPTNQRAELEAMILALTQTLKAYDRLPYHRMLDVTIRSDSKYAINCMTEWLPNWKANGWVNARGGPVKNRDLIEEAAQKQEEVEALGYLEYIHIPREQNTKADDACNWVLDQMERRAREEAEQEEEYW